MKKVFFVLVMFISGFSLAQNGAKIKFNSSDNTIDFGTISKDTDNGVRTLGFTNIGDSDLVISSVNSAFGCTVTNKSGVVGPGKSGVLEVKCSLNVGTMRKTIVVETNAINVDNGIVKLALKGEVLGN